MEFNLTEIAGLAAYIDHSRKQLAVLVDKIDSTAEIYPGWTIREILCNITSWEIVIHKAIQAFVSGDNPYFLHEQDFDQFNKEAIDFRADWSFEQVAKEWKDVRAALKKTILKLDESRLMEEMVLPWGSERPLAELIEIIGEHELEHSTDIEKIAG